ncbi:MAG: formate dehydrogenase subunit gamma [Rhizobiaceae bacterium]
MSLGRSILTLVSAVIIFVGAGFFEADGAAFAQATGPDKPTEGSVPGGTTDGSSSDAEIWRQIRQGNQGTVAGGSPGSGLMIQAQGEEWRQIRNGPLPMYSAWAILGMLIVLSLFFAARGRIRIEHGLSGRTLTRFNMLERASHWLLASSFIILALTGLNLIFGRSILLPILGPDAFAGLTVFGKFIHNYVGFAFMIALAMILLLWVAHNIPNRHDLNWLLRGGGILTRSHPPARKFNAGQKIIFWIVILCGVSISLSGWALLNPFTTSMFAKTFGIMNSVFGTEFSTALAPIQEQQLQTLWHSIMAVFMIVVIIAHIYIGSFGMEGALDAMTSGEVDENWAKEHHSLWVEEVKSQSNTESSSGKTQPAE